MYGNNYHANNNNNRENDGQQKIKKNSPILPPQIIQLKRYEYCTC